MENQQLVCPSRQCSSTQVGFGEGFLYKEQRDNTGTSPILSWPGSGCFLPTLSNAVSIIGAALLWCYWHHNECDGRAEKAFAKWLPGMFPSHLQSLVEVYCCTRGAILKEMSVKWLCWFVRLRNKVIPEILWSYYVLFGSSHVRQKEDIVIKYPRM